MAFPGLSAIMVGIKHLVCRRSVYHHCLALVRLAAHRVRGSDQPCPAVFSTSAHGYRTAAWSDLVSLAASCGDGDCQLRACPADWRYSGALMVRHVEALSDLCPGIGGGHGPSPFCWC